MVLSITFYPLYRLFLKYIKIPWASSLLTLIIILVVILGPFSYVTKALVHEITDLYSTIESKGFETLTRIEASPRLAGIFEKISSYKLFEGLDLQQSAVSTLKSLGKSLAAYTKDIFKNALVAIISFIIMCITIFYFLKDGNILANYIKSLLPFTEKERDRLEQRVKELVIAAIYGGLAVGVAQGILGGIAFFIFGLPSPVFWGSAIAMLSLVPFFGPTTIYLPAGIYLILTGSVAKGIGFLVYCVLLITTIDNIIKPMVIGGRTKLHTLLVFFSVLGGINFLGFLGFILGPLIAALSLSLLEIYRFEEDNTETEASE